MDRKVFFDTIRKSLFGGALSPEQVGGCEALLDAFISAGWSPEWAAYGLATAKWETAHSMQPTAEYGKGKGRKYGVKAGPYGHVYYGRGYVQLTWLINYERAKEEIGADFVAKPDLALEPGYAARIMVAGMSEGWFTGKKLADYLNGAKKDYRNARRIINGTDKAERIAELAEAFEAALRKSGYGVRVEGRPEKATTVAKPSASPQPVAATYAPNPPGSKEAATVTGLAPSPGFWSRFASIFSKGK